jgi:hypothetical protein
VDRIPESLLDRPVTGVNLMPGSLGDQLGSGPTLLVFLRFFGCIFCRETVADIREASESQPDYPAVLFVNQASPTECRAFVRRYWPDARVISDPNLEVYDEFGIGRASFIKALGPSVFRAYARAKAKGHVQGAPAGDIWRLPGVIVADQARIVWSYTPSHAADHPDFGAIPQIALQAEGN